MTPSPPVFSTAPESGAQAPAMLPAKVSEGAHSLNAKQLLTKGGGTIHWTVIHDGKRPTFERSGPLPHTLCRSESCWCLIRTSLLGNCLLQSRQASLFQSVSLSSSFSFLVSSSLCWGWAVRGCGGGVCSSSSSSS